MIKVFLVEDEVIMREGIRNIIDWEKEGIDFVGEAGDGELAWPMIKKLKPDILITDIKMPFMDGLELSTIVKKEFPHMKIIILSGYNEFDYAKKAISIGVEDYLLKPVTREKLLETVKMVCERIEKEREERQILKKYENDMQENMRMEQYKLFYDITSGEIQSAEAFRRGEQLGLDLAAGAYGIMIFRINVHAERKFSRMEAKAEETINSFARENRDSVLTFRKDMEEWIFLFKDETREAIMDKVKEAAIHLQGLLAPFDNIFYFGGVGKPVQRLRDLRNCYAEAGKAYSGRFFIEESKVVIYEEQHQLTTVEDEVIDIEAVDLTKFNGKTIRNFIKNGMLEEIERFIEELLYSIGDNNMKSLMLRQYVMMDIYFNVIEVLQELGNEKEEIVEKCGDIKHIASEVTTFERSRTYLEEFLRKAIVLRDSSAAHKEIGFMEEARDYIDQHCLEEEISLNVVAEYVNISTSYFSSVFRQEMGVTFVEYLTAKRMEKAKELLIHTNMKLQDIGNAIGYRDSRYFSFLFRKTQQCTPSEFRQKARANG